MEGAQRPLEAQPQLLGVTWAFEVSLDFFERLPFGFRQEKRCRNQIDDRKGSKKQEHVCVTVLADDRQEEHRQGGGDKLVEDERDAHADGTDACGHELRESQPHADTWSAGIKGDEGKKSKRDEIPVASGGDTSNTSALDFERGGSCSVEVCKGIGEEGVYAVCR